MTRLPLSGRRVVVTRPSGQADHLAGLIRAAGGEPVLFPVLEIRDAEDLRPLFALIERLDAFDVAVFVSANAVEKALDFVRSRRAWPASLRVATVGRASARALARYDLGAVIVPTSGFDSEALLDLPELKDMAGKRVVIFRGDGGRELLGDTLAARGARVEYAECYRRARPQADAAPLLAAWERAGLHAIIVTSSEALRNLFGLVGERGQPHMRQTPVFVSHPRIEQAARSLGITTVVLTGQGDEGMLNGMTLWFAGNNR